MDRFGIADLTINSGVFKPDGQDSIWLFVTDQKTPDRTQYEDKLQGDDLFFEGQPQGRTDDLIREHKSRGLEIVLFFRESKRAHPEYGFRLEGVFEYISDEPGPPSLFHLRRVNGSTIAGLVELERVQSDEQIRQNCRRYRQAQALHTERVRKLATGVRYWVHDVDEGAFVPSKFAGYRGMTFERYERAGEGFSTGETFDGGLTRRAIEALLGEFVASEELGHRLTAQLSSVAVESVDRSKWRFAQLPPVRGYFALMCHPKRYDGLGAVRTFDEIAWTIQRMNPQVGDRVLLWQAKGSGKDRGVIALGEVTRGLRVEPDPPAEAQFWKEEPTGPAERIRFRVLDCPGLPLWLRADSEWLADLNIAKATGGTVFSLSAEEWHRVAREAGLQEDLGEPDPLPPKQSGVGQGYGLTGKERRAVELHAQALVENHYVGLGFEVQDVSQGKPFDLLCKRGGEEIRVEVKGTTGSGEQVFLTRNEVTHAREHPNLVCLAIVSGISLVRSSSGLSLSGGTLCIRHPWEIDAGELEPLQFRYCPPPKR